jgi:hypothetical protein
MPDAPQGFMSTIQPIHLAGRWVGESQGCASPAHIWEIEQQGERLIIRTRWENASAETRLFGRIIAGTNAFSIGSVHALILGPLHFVAPNWDTNDIRGGVGPSYDVIFARPGLPELTAGAAYVRWRAGAG